MNIAHFQINISRTTSIFILVKHNCVLKTNTIIFRLRHYNCYHGQDTGHSDYFTESEVQLEVVTQEASRATLKSLRTTDVPGTDALHLVNKRSTAVSLYKENSSNNITNCLYIVTWTDAICSLHCGILLCHFCHSNV